VANKNAEGATSSEKLKKSHHLFLAFGGRIANERGFTVPTLATSLPNDISSFPTFHWFPWIF